MQFIPETKLNYHGQSDKVWFIMKMRYDNDVTNRIGAVYTENETELPWSIRKSVAYEEKWTGQRRDRLY